MDPINNKIDASIPTENVFGTFCAMRTTNNKDIYIKRHVKYTQIYTQINYGVSCDRFFFNNK